MYLLDMWAVGFTQCLKIAKYVSLEFSRVKEYLSLLSSIFAFLTCNLTFGAKNS